MMGSGKTTLGRLLAASTGWPLHDNDELIDRLYGMTPRQLLAEQGEDALRRAEDEALTAGLRLVPPCIVDAAGGTILSDSSRRLLGNALVVWLRASPETLFRRARDAPHRPWLDQGDGWFRQAVADRAPLYASLADLTIDTDAGQPAVAAGEIRAWLAEVAPCASLLDTHR